MRILHVPYCFHPDPVGGTEIYVEGLAQRQRRMGCDAAVAAPARQSAKYEHQGLAVWRFPVSPNPDVTAIYGGGDETAARAFGRIADEFAPDIVHLHAATAAVSVLLAEEVARRQIPIVLNYHTPTVSCVRGTLLKWGAEICDGTMEKVACASCALHANGLPRPLARVIGSIPAAATGWIGAAGLSGGPWTALRMPELIGLRIRSFQRLMQTVDRVVALCDWTRELLLRNGVPESRMVLCRQGILWDRNDFGAGACRQTQLPLRLAFLGRLDATKGVHLVVEAMREDRELPVRLDVFGIRQGPAGDRYASELDVAIAGDPRIRVLPPVPSAEVIARLRNYDAVVVPSQWLETGPLVVLEAFAANVPVIGSNLGGIAELVNGGVDGLLVEPFNSSAAWSVVLKTICNQPELLDRLRRGIRPPRHSEQAAVELMPVYESLAGAGLKLGASV